MKDPKLSKTEKQIEDSLLRGEYVPVDKKELDDIAKAISSRKKDAVLNIRVNSEDLKKIKAKAEKMGVKYQSFIAEYLHRIAQ